MKSEVTEPCLPASHSHHGQPPNKSRSKGKSYMSTWRDVFEVHSTYTRCLDALKTRRVIILGLFQHICMMKCIG